MQISFIGQGRFEDHPFEDLPTLLDRRDGFVWVDIPACDDRTAGLLSGAFGFHDDDVDSCVDRNCVPKLHNHRDHLFFVLHSPERGVNGHIHYVELDQFVGHRYLVTVHALNPAVKDRDRVAVRETAEVYRRIRAGTLRPSSPLQVSCEIVTTMTANMERFIEESTHGAWQLEQRVTAARRADSGALLEALFQTRHGLLAVGTMAALSREVYRGLKRLGSDQPDGENSLEDVVGRFKRLKASAEAEREYLEGVIDHYRARVDTERTAAAVSLALIAVVTLPITALASVYGMNVISYPDSDYRHLGIVLAVMLALCSALLTWAKRRGWLQWRKVSATIEPSSLMPSSSASPAVPARTANGDRTSVLQPSSS